MHQCNSCRERECGSGEVEGDTGDAGAEDWEGEGGALGGEARAEEEDWVLARVIKRPSRTPI